MTIPRYIAGIAVLYMAAFVAVITSAGALQGNVAVSLLHLWPLGVSAIAISVFGTLRVIARYGNAGGSIYFLPTVLHLTTLTLMLVVVWGVYQGMV